MCMYIIQQMDMVVCGAHHQKWDMKGLLLKMICSTIVVALCYIHICKSKNFPES